MNETNFKKALKKAEKAEIQLNSACGDMAIILQPYFPDEISVLYQEADGFVVLHNTDTQGLQSNLNTPVIEVVENVKEDKRFYFPL